MRIYTIGFTKKNAKQFFELIKSNEVALLLDVRLNNRSQLAGFTKGDDLPYFLSELCGCEYIHCPEFAPTQEILSDYRAKRISWQEYTNRFLELMEQRTASKKFWNCFADRERVVLLCSEPTPEKCHRRLLAELFAANSANPVEIVHL
jgi:uncharacterized protein (DUF488 family)